MKTLGHALRAAGVTRKCYPKVPHPSRGAAEAQLRSLTNRALEKTSRAHVYRCPDCGAWHVGGGVR